LDRVIMFVLDALGVGQMEDVPQTSPRDVGANTLLHILDEWGKDLGHTPKLDAFPKLGLGRTLDHPSLPGELLYPGVRVGVAELGYPGADSYIAHQTMMGSNMFGVKLQPFSENEAKVTEALKAKGHEVHRALPDLSVLLIDGCMVLGDNMEADPGLNYNVTGSLDLTDFDHILSVARIVRENVPVSRVITVAGTSIDAQGLVDLLYDAQDGLVAGIDSPSTGFYDRPGFRALHLGVQLDRSRQLPNLAAQACLPVSLIGKMADVIECEAATSLPGVQTEEVLETTLRALEDQDRGLIAVNVQELDLFGHKQDATGCARILALTDEGLGHIVERLRPSDLLFVYGDHGNDPTIGHAFHTRERVPVMAFSPGFEEDAKPLGQIATLADIGATAGTMLGLPVDRMEVGRSFLGSDNETDVR
jgi:phosphopentomutase